MPHIAFLSTDNLDDFFVYDELLIPHFEANGWKVSTVSWRNKSVDWSKFDYVIVRSTWDYQQHAQAFLACLETIEQSSAVLLNPLSLIKWNIEKHYLRDLEASGVPIVKTLWFSLFDKRDLYDAFDTLGCDTIVVKPVLSANADDTFKLSRDDIQVQSEHLSRLFSSREFMVQPFLDSIVREGEYSLFYLGGHYSHAIKKVPQQGDFRVQEEHGGSLYAVDADAIQQEMAQRALDAMPTPALYARVDLVRQQDQWGIMELELIEPSLYFNLDDASPVKFVEAMLALHHSHTA
jgi:glutathione synthase/RimK-type ligase-like ATP-grasp enzyme